MNLTLALVHEREGETAWQSHGPKEKNILIPKMKAILQRSPTLVQVGSLSPLSSPFFKHFFHVFYSPPTYHSMDRHKRGEKRKKIVHNQLRRGWQIQLKPHIRQVKIRGLRPHQSVAPALQLLPCCLGPVCDQRSRDIHRIMTSLWAVGIPRKAALVYNHSGLSDQRPVLFDSELCSTQGLTRR